MKALPLILACILLLLGCATVRHDEPRSVQSGDEPMADSIHARSDLATRLARLPPPAPGTARLAGRVEACEAKDSDYQCTLVVDRVLRYGAATPLLTSGTRIAVQVGAQVYDAAVLAPGKTIEATLLHQAPDRPSGAPADGWILTTLHSYVP